MSHVALSHVDGCKNARAIFEAALPHAALFYLPDEAHSAEIDGAPKDRILGPIRAWQERGIMPYAMTATHFTKQGAFAPELAAQGGSLQVVSIFSAPDHERLTWITRVTVKHSAWNAAYYGRFRQEFDETYWIDEIQPHSDSFLERRGLDASVASSLSHFMWLAQALESTRYTAIESKVSRQVARAESLPRQSWIIQVRPLRSATISMKHQFRDVVKAAHAVRGHLRTNHRTGEKSIRVRPHIRGRGDAIQIKDYHVEAAR